ncbi:MAG: hypothetical protein Q8O76_12950, partial [Chloroflexota bacterium]|nr:hypothetical protein [Chloroflexota bacterium]
MKGTKGAIWRGLAFITILALILGALPLAPTALAAEGGNKTEAKHLWGQGDSTKSDSRTLASGQSYWYHILTSSTSPNIQLSLTSNADAIFEVSFGTETSPRIFNSKFFNLPTGAGDWYIQVRSPLLGDFFTITATPGAGAGVPTPTPSPSPTVTAGDGSNRNNPVRLVLGTPSPGSLSSIMARWFLFDYSGTDPVTVDLQGDAVLNMNVYKGSNQYFEPGGSYTRFFTLQGSFNAGQYFFEVRGTSPGMAFTISAHTGTGGGAAGDSRSNPEPMDDSLPQMRSIGNSPVSSKWFSRNFSGALDLEALLGTQDPDAELRVYGPGGYMLPGQPMGQRFFKILQSSGSGNYLFEVTNVQGATFDITLRAPMAAESCSQASPCDLTADQPAPGNITSGGAKWFRYLHASAGRRADVMLRNAP